METGAIVPGDVDSSELVRRILSTDPAEQMPPPETKKHLTPAQTAALAEWIRTGAEYQPHWAFIPPTRPAVPKPPVESWGRNPIDHFVAVRLAAAGLQAAAEADRATLARRVSLDLTGLPPQPEVVAEFVSDPAPDAYERLVDKLLASPHWGEHRSRYWLDAARYADTHGIHIDNYRAMWTYRDWVIAAFNRNLPFDEFTIENLAGDLVPNATIEQQVASGFNRCLPTTSEGGAIEEEYLVLYARDRVETTSQVWLGLTAGCAVCHDHKFDPLTQREFYQLAALFNNTTQPAMDGNLRDTAPTVQLLSDEDRARWEELERDLGESEKRYAELRTQKEPEFEEWLAGEPQVTGAELPAATPEFVAQLADDRDTIRYQYQGQERETQRNSSTFWIPGRTGRHGAITNHGEILAEADVANFETGEPFTVAAWIKLRDSDPRGAVLSRVDESADLRGWDLWIEDRRLVMHLVDRWPTSAIRVTTASEYPRNEWVHVAAVYDGSQRAAGVRLYLNGREQPVELQNDSLSGSIRSDAPFKIGARNRSGAINGMQIEDVFVYRAALSDREVQALRDAKLPAIAANRAGEWTAEEKELLFTWWLEHNSDEGGQVAERIAKLKQERSAITARTPVALVMQEKPTAPVAHVLHRGEYDQRREEVGPETPAFLPPFPTEAPRNRLGFAQWLVAPNHPLTARVAVNRFWSEVFGAGLVESVGDFGVQGQLPSHPELLDWLAIEFRESGWDVKHLFKLMVTSATYRQQAVVSEAALELDPHNRLLSHGPRFRMDAEMVRDYALAASGLLSPKVGGPSVRPYQPGGVWEAVAMVQSNTGSYQQDVGDAVYRRSLYTLWKRSAPPAALEVLNAPSREVCTMVRERTNTPLQALVTMNDPQLIEAARALAGQVISAASDDDQRIRQLAAKLLARQLRPEEQAVLGRSLERFVAHYTQAPKDALQLIEVGDSQAPTALPAEQLAAWTMLVNQMLNLDEVLNK